MERLWPERVDLRRDANGVTALATRALGAVAMQPSSKSHYNVSIQAPTDLIERARHACISPQSASRLYFLGAQTCAT